MFTYRVILAFAVSLVFLIFSSAVLAQSVDIRVEPVNPEAEIGEEAIFNVFVKNVGDKRDMFRLHGDPLDSGLFSSFYDYIITSPDQFKLSPGETKKIQVTVQLSDKAPVEQFFSGKLILDSPTTYGFEEIIFVEPYVLPKDRTLYLFVEDSGEIIPGQEYTLTIVVSNRQKIDVNGAEIKLISSLEHVEETFIRDIPANEDVSFYRVFTLPTSIEPGLYDAHAEVYVRDKLKGSYDVELEVAGKAYLGEEKNVDKSFLKATLALEKENTGNTAVEQRLKYNAGFFERFFITTKPQPTSIEQGVFIWDFTLGPNERYSVEIERSYLPLLYGLIVVVLVFIGFVVYINRSVTLRKRIFVSKGSQDGVYDLRVLLILKNGHRLPVSHVRVMDILPNTLHPTYEFMTVKPATIQKGMYGQRFVWNLEKLQPKEERVFTYKVRIRLYDVGGNTVLPAAMMQYLESGKTKSVKSDRLFVGKKQ